MSDQCHHEYTEREIAIYDGMCPICCNDKVAALEAENASLRTQLKAWHEVFETTQLTHARARLEKAEQSLANARDEALEDAAQIAQLWNPHLASNYAPQAIAASIRSLKSPSSGGEK